MIDLEQYLYDRIKSVFDGWQEKDIYAVSFFVESNGCYEYRGFSNVTNLSISFNTETGCGGAGSRSEARWNYAYWPQDVTEIFDCWHQNPQTDLLFDWYAQQGITNIGDEDDDDEAPVGYRELVDVLAKVARRFQQEGYWLKKLGRSIPILIHDLEYIPCVMAATAYANPNGEAADFLSEWEDAEPEEVDPEIRAELGRIFDGVMSHFGESGFLERVEKLDDDPTDSDVEELMKLIFGN